MEWQSFAKLGRKEKEKKEKKWEPLVKAFTLCNPKPLFKFSSYSLPVLALHNTLYTSQHYCQNTTVG